MRFQDKIAIGLQAIRATTSTAYSAAKAGGHALTKNLAIELAPYKIRENAISPGVIETPVFNTFLTRAGRAAWPGSVQPNSTFDETRASDRSNPFQAWGATVLCLFGPEARVSNFWLRDFT